MVEFSDVVKGLVPEDQVMGVDDGNVEGIDVIALIAAAVEGTATEAQLSALAGLLSAHEADTENPHTVTKAQVGLGNVANVAPADLPVSDATATALAAKVASADIPGGDPAELLTTADIGGSGERGVAGLVDGIVPSSRLPSVALPTAALDLGRVIAWDTFDRADSADLGTSDSGHPWIESNPADWAIADGRAVSAAGAIRTAVIDPLALDIEIEATVETTEAAQGGGLCFRHSGVSDPTSASWLRARLATDSVLLGKRDDATNVTLVENTDADFTQGGLFRMKVTIRGDLIRVYVDGEMYIEHTLTSGDETTFGSWTYAGLQATRPSQRFDDLIIRAAS